jgi:hypothetical protein
MSGGVPAANPANPSWAFTGDPWITGGYSASNASGQEAAPPATNQQTFVFYFVDGGDTGQPVLSLTNGTVGPLNAASVTFNVTGPTVPTVTTDPNQANPGYTGIWPNQAGTGQVLAFAGMPAPAQVGQGLDGIILQADPQPPSAPSGTYSWVQVLNYDTIQVITSAGSADRSPTSAGPFVPPVLDNRYPYGSTYSVNATNDLVVDVPALPLCQQWGEAARSFSATMYLLWTPDAGASGCSGGACTIPIPLGSVNWQWSGDAINTLLPFLPSGAGYTVAAPGCGSPLQTAGFVSASMYPSWTAVSTYTFTCP